MPLLQFLMENGGLETAKSNVLRLSSCLKQGLERVLSFQISAVRPPCRIMFIRTMAKMALSISCP